MRAVPFCTSSDPRLTTTQPLLEAVSNQELLGRAIIEVWSVDSRATVIGLADAPTTIQKCAVAALVAQPIRLNTRIPWHSYPATQDIAGQSNLRDNHSPTHSSIQCCYNCNTVVRIHCSVHRGCSIDRRGCLGHKIFLLLQSGDPGLNILGGQECRLGRFYRTYVSQLIIYNDCCRR